MALIREADRQAIPAEVEAHRRHRSTSRPVRGALRRARGPAEIWFAWPIAFRSPAVRVAREPLAGRGGRGAVIAVHASLSVPGVG